MDEKESGDLVKRVCEVMTLLTELGAQREKHFHEYAEKGEEYRTIIAEIGRQNLQTERMLREMMKAVGDALKAIGKSEANMDAITLSHERQLAEMSHGYEKRLNELTAFLKEANARADEVQKQNDMLIQQNITKDTELSQLHRTITELMLRMSHSGALVTFGDTNNQTQLSKQVGG